MTKKLLYLCTAISTLTLANAQEFVNDNYNALTIGNVGTDVAGTAAGQGGYYTFATSGVNTDFQIVSDVPAQGNVVQLTGSATATNTRFMYKNISTAWAARTVGNDVINVEFDLFTGTATTSKNSARLYIYSDDGSTALAGLSLNLETKAISGVAYYDNAGTLGTYAFNLGTAGAVVTLTANTWVRVGVSYNTTTNEVIWKGPGFYAGVPGAGTISGAATPSELDYLHGAGTGNTISVTSRYDNLVARASATENLLGKSDFNSVKATIANVYPNPVVDFASINLVDAQINAITVTDINGRIVKTGNSNELLNAKIDLSNLTAGIYLMTIETDKGVSTEKIIKN